MRTEAAVHALGKGLPATTCRLGVVVLVAMVTGCAFGEPRPDPEPSPTPSTAQVRYDPIDKEFCDDARVNEVPVRLGLTDELGDRDSDRFSGYNDGHSDTGVFRWYWWEAFCWYEAYAEDDGRRWFKPRGGATVRVHSDPQSAHDHYESELEWRSWFGDRETPVTEVAVEGWWDEGVRLDQPDARYLGDSFASMYYLYHDNLYVSVSLVTEVFREEETEEVIARSHELLDALVGEVIAHVPLTAGG